MSEDQRQIRIDKIDRLREDGVAVYPDHFDVSHVLGDAAKLEEGARPRLAGRLLLIRTMGGLTFAHLGDVTGKLQISVKRDEVGRETYDRLRKLIDLGDFLGAEGELYRTKTGELTLRVETLTFLGKALLPLPEKWHGLQDVELCYRRRYLDLIMNEQTRERFRLRATVTRTIREILDAAGFDEVETPILQNKASGALAKPFRTHHNAMDIDVYLRIAPETYLKRLVVGGFNRVYEFARCFRNEGMDPSHLQEFTMLEYYVAYWSYRENMAFTESLIKDVVKATTGGLILRRDGKEIDLAGPWPRKSMRELILDGTGLDIDDHETADALRTAIAGLGVEIEDAENLGRGTLIDQLYKKTVRPDLDGPVFLIQHPTDLSPLARRNDDDPRCVDRFQLVIAGWEVVNAYSELVDPLDQRGRLEEQAGLRQGGDEEALEMDEDYLTAMEHGMPPISGWGMGIDRFVSLLSEVDNLRDTVFFPLMRPLEAAAEETPAAPMAESAVEEAEESGIDLEAVDGLVAALGDEELTRRASRVGAAMAGVAAEVGADVAVWEATGRASVVAPEVLREAGASDALAGAVAAREDAESRTGRLAVALAACEQATGLVLAVASVNPERSVQAVKTKSVRKRLGKKGFASRVDRDAIRAAETLGLEVGAFLDLVVVALKAEDAPEG